MDRGSIRDLEEQIREHEGDTTELKRTRNSLLNVSKLPPEVLSDIFLWNVVPKDDFDELDEGSHNFLFVCHHWFEVASCTPELWSFWGDSLKDWTRWCHHPGTAPLDLILDANYGLGDDKVRNSSRFGTTLRNALQDRAANNAIRRVHLAASDPELLNSILASLTSNNGELRSNCIESFILWNLDDSASVDVSDFFAHYRFPRLQRIDFIGCTISSWDHLTSRTSALTTLELDFGKPPPTPTTSQLLSIFTSNPTLRKVILLGCAVPNDGNDESSTRVQLHHLKELQLDGSLRHVIRLLHQLDHPRNMDHLCLNVYDCNLSDIPQIIGLYLQDHFQRRNKSQNGLNLRVSSEHQVAYRSSLIEFRAGDAGGINLSAPDWAQINTFVVIAIVLNGTPPKSVLERAALDLVPCAPLEEVVYFHAQSNPAVMEDTHTQFPNLRALSFDATSLPTAFSNPNLIGDGRVFPSLEHVLLDHLVDNDGDWSPLVDFLACRVSSGNRLDTLVIAGSPHVCRQVIKAIRGMVRELKADHLDPACPSGACRGP